MNKTSSTDLFRCKIYEPVFKNIVNSYQNKNYSDEVVYNGGSSGGKSVNIAHNIVFWLPENEGDQALVVVYSTAHKKNTRDLLCEILEKHGYNYKTKQDMSGDVVIDYGNLNKITIKSVETSSIANLEEKFKTGNSYNPKIKFLWFEEFTAVLNAFRSTRTFASAKSRLLRLLIKKKVIFYSYNPPPLHHVLWGWLKEFDGLKIYSTIYDLPKKWQDQNTLKEANKMKKSNNLRWRGIYKGEKTLNDGSAFIIDESIWTELLPKEEYSRFFIHTDEATLNATTFSLIGLANNGEVHLINNWYHSSKVDGQKKSPSTYATFFVKWFESLNVEVREVVTDGLGFAMEIKKKGFKIKSMGSYKDRIKGYYLMDKLISEGRFKIVDDKSNVLAYEQFVNSTKEYNRIFKPMVSKKGESGEDQTLHTHIVDTIMYWCLVNEKNVLRGDIDEYNRYIKS